ncbi:MAG: hypothetical protein JNK48_29010 [Bryobacterales bacterium]|nr:hypothetical protein [Bryobacterales bacterium]
MSVWQDLHSDQGDLFSLRVTVEAHLLEELLEILASAPFSINPEIQHHAELLRDGKSVPAVHVDFPAWQSQISTWRDLLTQSHVPAEFAVTRMLEEIRA